LPFNWLSDPNIVFYVSPSLGINEIFVGDLDVDYARQAAEAQVLRLASRAAAIDAPPAPGGDSGIGGSDPGSDWSGGPWTYGANDFWLEAVSVTSNLFNVILHGTTNGSTYLITSTEALNPQPNNLWVVEGTLQGGTGAATPFALGTATRTNSLFIRAQACDACATTALPLWWQLAYFGVTAVDPNTDYDNDGTNNLAEYLGGTDPNKIRFSISVTSQYFSTSAVPMQLNIVGGVPSYIAVLINDTNMADANWQTFTSPTLLLPTPTNGTYVVQVGLCGLATNSAQAWQSVTLFRDATPLTLELTNMMALNGSRPFIDPAGYTTRALKTITWTVVEANGATSSADGMLVAQSWNPLDRYHTTNWFQCVDVPLLPGGNWISIQAVDWAGNVAVTNFEYFLDFTGDTTPPSLRLVWPQSGAHVYGDSFNVQAWTDNDTAAVTLACYGTNGTVQTVKGVVERGGNVWVQNVPLAAGTNNFTLTANSAGGYSRGINFSVIQSDTAWSVTPLTQDDLKYGYAKVTGTIADPDATVTVNEIQGTNYGNGSWEADYVPLPPGGTVAVQATAHLFGGEILETLLTYVRDPISFTKTYAYKLDYSDVFEAVGDTAYATEIVHSEVQWARGVGGTKLDTVSYVYVDPPGVWSNQTVTVWPADNGYWPYLPGQQVINDYSNGVLFSSDTKTVGPPSVDWMEQSAASGVWESAGFPVPYSESSSRDTGLFTGGQGARESQGVIDLIAPLTVESELLPYMNEWDFLDGFSPFLQQSSPLVSVPSQLIRVGTLGNLGNDGHLFTVQSSGNEIVITLTAPPTSYYGALPWVLKHKPQILANSIPLDPARVVATNCVGQKIVFQLAFDPSLPDGVLVTNQNQWFLPPKYVNAYEWFQPSMPTLTNNDGNYFVTMCHPELTVWTSAGYGIDLPACTKYQQQDWPLSQPETGAWWLSGGDKMVSCYPTLTFANGQKGSLIVRGQFNVYRPSANADVASPGSVSLDGNFYLEDNLVEFNGHVQSDYPGDANWTQLINRDCQQAFYIETGTWGHFWLDTSLFYNTLPTPVGPGINRPVPLEDSPEVVIDVHVSNIDPFKTYLRFLPTGSDSIWVTLGREDWGWHGDAYVGLMTDNHGITAPQYTPTDEFPEWSDVFVSDEH
jgi:hypothetical protein